MLRCTLGGRLEIERRLLFHLLAQADGLRELGFHRLGERGRFRDPRLRFLLMRGQQLGRLRHLHGVIL